jgi:hypothetical protein
MVSKQSYEKRKKVILQDPAICEDNRELWAKFFVYQETKLKRVNGLPSLDVGCFKTLTTYLCRFTVLNRWLGNKPWIKLTEPDIRRFYNDFEDGKLLTSRGKPVKDRKSYYSKILKSKPFEMAGKKELAKKVIEFGFVTKNEVRFIEIETFRKIVDFATQPKHKALLWLSWDVGENINSLLKLQKKDFRRQIDDETGMIEYKVTLAKNKLKRTRRARGNLTLFEETSKYLDLILSDVGDENVVFDFSYSNAYLLLERAVRLSKSSCIPNGEPVTWKDLRSSMACHLLKEGWSTNEVNSRLGHKPSSDEIDKYWNFLALDDKRPKQRINQNNIEKLSKEVKLYKQITQRLSKRINDIQHFAKIKSVKEVAEKEV